MILKESYKFSMIICFLIIYCLCSVVKVTIITVCETNNIFLNLNWENVALAFVHFYNIMKWINYHSKKVCRHLGNIFPDYTIQGFMPIEKYNRMIDIFDLGSLHIFSPLCTPHFPVFVRPINSHFNAYA